ncbi:MAG: ABC transporter ATP-binding protein [Candidatus Puniceispirillaceae bacterium]|nr:ABC transporter ATP-binding protein [Candidatus Puniceispirillum sp.]MDB2528834.1 ABC transporter ATP-binding protein [Alphaproteobacteria bacterium]
MSSPSPSQALLELRDVRRGYHQGESRLDVLNGASLSVRAGEMKALVGPSGSGKSTLLNIAGLLEQPDSGTVFIDGIDSARLRSAKRTLLRRQHIGFVFQFHRLLPEFSALENVMIPQMLAGLDKFEASDRAAQLLAMVGLQDRVDHRPGLLSGGEQQRVAIARAVANAPRVLLADEPTGNLDPDTAKDVFGHLAAITRATRTAALVVTHNQQLALNMDSILTIENGHVVELA